MIYPFYFHIGDSVVINSENVHKGKKGTVVALELSEKRTVASVRFPTDEGDSSRARFNETELRAG